MSVPERIERASRFIEGLPPLPSRAVAPPAPAGSPVRILVAEGDPRYRGLLLAVLTRAGCQANAPESPAALLAALTDSQPDAILLDAALAARDAGKLPARIASVAPDLPIIALAASPADARGAIRLGAADFAPRAGRLEDLPGIIERNVVRVAIPLHEDAAAGNSASPTACETMLDALLSALDTRDAEPEGHAERVTACTMVLADALGVAGEERYDLERGALLHDIGKIGVPDRILLKGGPLTTEEWSEVRRHPVIGFQMCRRIPFLRGAAQVILHHHERWDGGGYPDGLREEMVPLGARIFAVADAYDAMTTDRPHRRAVPNDLALQELRRHQGSQFDPTVVEAFLRTQRGAGVNG